MVNQIDSFHGAALPAVDRHTRNDLANLVRQFLDEQITAFEFDERLDEFRHSPDAAVRFVAEAAWYHYDDCDDHLVALAKREWDYFQRLLLLLASNHTVERVTTRRRSWAQVAAACALGGFLWTAARLGWGYHLLVAAMPFGLVSVWIAWIRQKAANERTAQLDSFPFETLPELRSAVRATVFRKISYPTRLSTRTIRSPLIGWCYQLQFYLMWLMFSPLALTLQMLPIKRTRIRIMESS